MHPRPSFEQTWYNIISQSYIPNVKHLSKVVPEKKIFEFFSIFLYGSDQGRPWVGPF